MTGPGAVYTALSAATILLVALAAGLREPRFCYGLGLLVVMAQSLWGHVGGAGAFTACSAISLVLSVVARDGTGAFFNGSFLAIPVYLLGVWGLARFMGATLEQGSLKAQLAQEGAAEAVAELEEKLEAERRLISAGRQRIDKFFMLTAITNSLSASLELDEVIGRVLRSVRELAGVSGTASLVLFDEDALKVYRIEQDSLVIAREETDPFSGWVKIRLMPLFVPDVGRDLRFRGVAGIPEGAVAVMAVPLVHGQGAIGALMMYGGAADAFSQEDWRLLSLLGDLAGVAIQNAMLYRRTQDEAITDGLTGTFVHRFFQERLADEVRRAAETGAPLTMLMADIDNFKSLNDTFGHVAGDAVLRGVARVLKEGIRGTDMVARYGGEEFAILLIETDSPGGMLVAERLRASVAKLTFPETEVDRGVTISIGTATFPEHASDRRGLVERSDEAMYMAKRSGKNRVICWQPAK